MTAARDRRDPAPGRPPSWCQTPSVRRLTPPLFQQLAQLTQHLGQQLLFAHQQRRALRPTRGDVGQGQGLHEASLRRWSAMRDKSASTNPGGGSSQLSEVRTATLRRMAADGGVRRRVPLPDCFLISLSNRSIVAALIAISPCEPRARVADGRAAPSLDQDRHQGPQSLAANPVRRLPNHDRRCRTACRKFAVRSAGSDERPPGPPRSSRSATSKKPGCRPIPEPPLSQRRVD